MTPPAHQQIDKVRLTRDAGAVGAEEVIEGDPEPAEPARPSLEGADQPVEALGLLGPHRFREQLSPPPEPDQPAVGPAQLLLEPGLLVAMMHEGVSNRPLAGRNLVIVVLGKLDDPAL